MNKQSGVAVLAAVGLLLCSFLTLQGSPSSFNAGQLPLMTPVPRELLPRIGTYWLLVGPAGGKPCPPLPCPPGDMPDVPIYSLGNGKFLVDDSEVDYEAKRQEQALNRMLDLLEFGEAQPMAMQSYSTEDLWLEATNISAGCIWLNLHNATNLVYAIWTATNLLDGWTIETDLWPTNQECTFLQLQTHDRESLFVRAQDWTGVTHGQNLVPDWWFWRHFGSTLLSDDQLDGVGNTLLYDYQHNLDPNVIAFSVVLTNKYVNSPEVPIELNIVSGTPFFVSILIDSTNYTEAAWQPCTSTAFPVVVGQAMGWHHVLVGLKGRAEESSPVWQRTRVKLCALPPQFVITSPSNLVSQPLIQLAGYSTRPLQHIACTLSNATGVFSNQTVLLLDRSFDTNTWEFTTNTFKAYDLEITNGLNVVTLAGTDEAGNFSATNFLVTLTSDQAPPELNLIWPQDGMSLCGGEFTLQGNTDDPSADIIATLLNSDGSSSTFHSVTERDGKFWIENILLHDTVTGLVLSARDCWGNMATTNIALSKSPLTLTIDPIDPDQLHQESITLSGTVDDPDCVVSVNGTQALVSVEGTWIATNVFIQQRNTATFHVTAVASTVQQQSSLRLNDSDGYTQEVLFSPGTIANLATNLDKPSRSYLEHYQQEESEIRHELYDYESGPQGTLDGNAKLSMEWRDRRGGFRNAQWLDLVTGPHYSGTFTNGCASTAAWPSTLDPFFVSGTLVDSPSGCEGTGPQPPLLVREHRHLWPAYSFQFPFFDELFGWCLHSGSASGENRTLLTRKLYTGGKAILKHWSVWRSKARVYEHKLSGISGRYRAPLYGSAEVQSQKVQIGQLGSLHADGLRYNSLPQGETLDVTPSVRGPDWYTFSDPELQQNMLVPRVHCRAPGDQRLDRTTLGVGEQDTLAYLPAETTWTTTGGSLSAASGISTIFTAPEHKTNITVTATIRDVVVRVDFSILEPTGIDHADFVSYIPYDSTTKAGVGMHLRPHVGPLTVSFAHLTLTEVGRDASDITGYFEVVTPPSHIGHGADEPFGIGVDNSWVNGDDAGSGGWMPPFLGGGSYTWQIPATWRIGNGQQHSMTNGWEQVHTLLSNGTMKVRKFGHTVSRTLSNVYTHEYSP